MYDISRSVNQQHPHLYGNILATSIPHTMKTIKIKIKFQSQIVDFIQNTGESKPWLDWNYMQIGINLNENK